MLAGSSDLNIRGQGLMTCHPERKPDRRPRRPTILWVHVLLATDTIPAPLKMSEFTIESASLKANISLVCCCGTRIPGLDGRGAQDK
jgi:hypothetical protein